MASNGEQVERGSGTPLYRQVAEILRQRIERGLVRPGERISTEYEFCDEFGVSRTSIRQALSELVHEGLLQRRQGSGTYVRSEFGLGSHTITALVTEDPWVVPLKEAVSSFNAGNPATPLKLDVEVLGRPQLRQKILAAVGRGEAPDLALVDWPWVAEFAALHFLHSLDELDGEWVEAFRDDLFPAFADETQPPLYAIQPEANVSVIWYRRDWLKEAGIAPPSSWTELVDAASHFAQNGRGGIAFVAGTTAGETTTYQLLPFLWSAGADFFSNRSGEIDDRVVSAVQFLLDLVKTHQVSPSEAPFFSWDRPARLFAAGETAFAVGGSYEKPRIQELAGWDEAAFEQHVGYMPVPPPPGGHPAAVVGGMAFVVFQQSGNPQLAFEIVKRVASPKLMRAFCAHSGRCPTRVSVAQSLDQTTDRFSKEIAELLHTARPRCGIAEYSKVSEQFQLMVEDAITERLSPTQAVRRASEIIRILLG